MGTLIENDLPVSHIMQIIDAHLFIASQNSGRT
jgi:hypothetical protein